MASPGHQHCRGQKSSYQGRWQKPAHQTATKSDPPVEIYCPPTSFPSKAFVCFLIFESLRPIWSQYVTNVCVCVCCSVIFFFTPWYHMFVWHYPKASSRWKWGRRNNPVPKGQMNSLGRKERGRKCSVLPRSARVHTAHSSSVPLASDCSWERKVERVEGATSPSLGRQALWRHGHSLCWGVPSQQSPGNACQPHLLSATSGSEVYGELFLF